MVTIPFSEFSQRIDRIRKVMEKGSADIFLIYGDEYRRENLRYVSNYWPIFERGMLAVGLKKDPVLLVSPECEHIAEEMSAWKDIRLLKEIGMSYVPEEVEFTNVNFTSFAEIIRELSGGRKNIKIMISGIDAMSVVLYEKIKSAVDDGEIRGIKPHAIFDENDALDTDEIRVVSNVESVLDALDHGEKNAKVTLPDKHLVENGDITLRHQIVQRAVVVRE